ncbi:tetratricopeptide repeat protein [Kitasatospora sp. GAS1066B]|uniref:ATP-binding protein n=1 Tax=Kitasatospora sp. GAS1066B TaxID=3156271 RepID=UPI0035164132
MTPRQLPGAGRHFVNRRGEMGRLDTIATEAPGSDDQSATLVVAVITGTAGVGKTSLAVHWAHRIRRRFPDGALYVNLRGHDAAAPVAPEQVLDRFLRDLGVPTVAIPVHPEDRASLYRSIMADRRMLVMLDNAAAAAQVRPLLPATPGCLVLVTSRNSLAGLVAREGAYRVDLGRFPEADAVTLLRAVTASYRTQDDPGELTELARLCARLPLALRIAAERAAGRPRMLLAELIADLRDESARWDVLTAEGEAEADAMSSVFTWSYQALPEGAARQFRLLALHPGDQFGLPAAAVLAGTTAAEARRNLDALVGAHLVEEIASARYQLHDLLRAYAADRVRDVESEQVRAESRRRILAWYLYTAGNAQSAIAPFDRYELDQQVPQDAAPLVFDGYQPAFQWYSAEADNLVATTRAAAEFGFHRIAWRLAVVLRAVYMHQNAFEDWESTARIGISSAAQAGERAGEAEALESLGKAYFQSRRLAESEECHRAALAVRRDIGDRFGEAVSINALGLLGLRRRELDAARSHFEASAAIFRQLGDLRWTALLQGNLAESLCELGRFQEAAETLCEALAVFRELGDRSGEGNALFFLSRAQRELGRTGEARASVDAALAIAAEAGNSVWQAHWLVELANVERAAGRPEDALRSSRLAADIQRRLGDRSRAATALDRAGEACRDLGRFGEAADLHRQAVETHREFGDRWQLAGALDNLARCLRHDGAVDEARGHWAEALALLSDFADPQALALSRRIALRLADL